MLGLGVLGGYVIIALGQFFAIPASNRRERDRVAGVPQPAKTFDGCPVLSAKSRFG